MISAVEQKHEWRVNWPENFHSSLGLTLCTLEGQLNLKDISTSVCQNI